MNILSKLTFESRRPRDQIAVINTESLLNNRFSNHERVQSVVLCPLTQHVLQMVGKLLQFRYECLQ
jgi:hypothetical protein